MFLVAIVGGKHKDLVAVAFYFCGSRIHIVDFVVVVMSSGISSVVGVVV